MTRRLGDKLGKKKVFLTGAILYTVGLIVVVISPNTAVFVLGWGLIWPMGMVLVIPNSIALIMYFYHGKQRAVAYGAYGAVLSSVAAMAPVVVGWVAGLTDWRMALAMSPLMGVLTILITLKMPETDRDESIKIDLSSVLLSMASFGLFLLTTTQAGHFGWFFEKRPLVIDGTEISLMGLSVVPYLYALSFILFYFFVARGNKLKARGEAPLLDASLFANLPFTIGMSVGALFFLVNAAMMFAVALFLQAAAHFGPLQTAMVLLPFSAMQAVVSFTSPGLGKTIAPKWIVAAGSLVMAVGIALVSSAAAVDMSTWDMLPGMLVAGLGAGLMMAQGTSVTMMSVSPEQSGAASGLSETMKEVIGQGFAIALAGAVLFGAVYTSMTDSFEQKEGLQLTEQETAAIVIELEDTFQEISELEEKEFVSGLPEATRESYQSIVSNAAETGVRAALDVTQVVLLICFLLALFLPPTKLEE